MIQESVIEQQIEALLKTTGEIELEQAKEQFKKGLTSIIVAAIKSIQITIQPGLIQTAGSPAAQSNVAPIILINSIS